MAEAVAGALASIGAACGCLMILEDLHWSDFETLAVVEYLADHLAEQPVIVMGTVRTGESSRAERLAQLLRERRAAGVIALRSLGREATEQMLAACLDTGEVPPEVRRFVLDHAEGVPLFVEELLVGLVDSGALRRSGDGWRVTGPLTTVVPLTYVEAVRHRLHRMDPADRDLVLTAAVLGRRFDWSLLPAASGRGEAEVLESLRRATGSLILEADAANGAFRFRHALTRDAVLGELLAPEQAAIAARALDALEAADRSASEERVDWRPSAFNAHTSVIFSSSTRNTTMPAPWVLLRWVMTSGGYIDGPHPSRPWSSPGTRARCVHATTTDTGDPSCCGVSL